MPETAIAQNSFGFFLSAPTILLYVAGLAYALVSRLRPLWIRGDWPRVIAGLVILGAIVLEMYTPLGAESAHSLLHDPFSQLVRVTAMLALLIVTTISRINLSGANMYTERAYKGYFLSAALLSTAGACYLASAYDLISLFIAIELTIFPAYMLMYTIVQLQSDRERMREANERFLRTLMFGMFSSFLFAAGVSVLYGIGGATELIQLRINLSVVFLSFQKIGPALLLGASLIGVGLAARMGLAPFHLWLGDQYKHSANGVGALLWISGGITGLVGVARIFDNALVAFSETVMAPLNWPPLFVLIASICCLLAIVATLRERSIIRNVVWMVMAQFSVAVLGLTTLTEVSVNSGVGQFMVALVSGALVLSLLSLFNDTQGQLSISAVRGFARRHLIVGSCIAIGLATLSAAPLTGGFNPRVVQIGEAFAADQLWVSTLIVITSIYMLLLTIRIITALFRSPIESDSARIAPFNLFQQGIGISVAAVLLYFGIWPTALQEVTSTVAKLFVL